jgi:hypothetical protein
MLSAYWNGLNRIREIPGDWVRGSRESGEES